MHGVLGVSSLYNIISIKSRMGFVGRDRAGMEIIIRFSFLVPIHELQNAGVVLRRSIA